MAGTTKRSGLGAKPLAVLMREISGTAAVSIFRGIMEEADAQKISVALFNAGQLGRDAHSALYDLVECREYCGLITWASSDIDETVSYYQRFSSIPFVSLSIRLPGVPCIQADSYHGMKEAVEHLITEHGKRRIGFVRGPETHVYARERYEGWRDALRAHNLEADLQTAPGGWSKSEGNKAVGFFLDERGLAPGPGLDSMVCVNDQIAIGALEELQARGVSVPGQLAIVGYNDTKEGRCTTPPITSVAMPFREQGMAAVRMALALARGEAPSEEVKLSARLVLGQSCGCNSLSAKILKPEPHAVPAEPSKSPPKPSRLSSFLARARKKDSSPSAQEGQESRIVEAMTASIKEGFSAHDDPRADPRGLAEALYHSFMLALEGGDRRVFLNVLSEKLRVLIDGGVGMAVLQSALSAMRQPLRPILEEQGRLLLAEELWSQGCVMVNETSIRLKEAEYLKVVSQEQILHALGTKLITTFNISKFVDILCAELPKLGIPAFYMALYERGPKGFGASVSRRARLIAGMDEDGRIDIQSDGISFDSAQIIPPQTLKAQHRSFIVEPLYFGKTQFGYAVFVAGPREGSVYEILRAQLSSSLYGALLLEENEEVRAFLQNTLDVMEAEVTSVHRSSDSINNGVSSGSTAMEEVAANIHELSKNLGGVMENVTAAVRLAEEASLEMRRLSKESMDIDEVIKTIADIAERTKILSLNATIQAARAGAAGRSFAVVAREVKELALNTVDSASAISAMISKILDSTKGTEESIVKAREAISTAADLSTQMVQAIREQEAATADVSKTLIASAQGTRDIASALERISLIGKKHPTARAGD